MFDSLTKPDATDSDWIATRIKFEWFDAWDKWRYDNDLETDPAIAWDYRRQFHQPGTDRDGDNYFLTADWEYSDRADFGPLDALIITAMGHDRNLGWPAPPESGMLNKKSGMTPLNGSMPSQ
jgi:hypothetical protein